MDTDFSTPIDLDIPTYQQHRSNQIDHTLVDVREDWEYAHGHIAGAIHIPLNELQERVGEVPDDKPVVVVCAHGIRSVYGSQILVSLGYGSVYNLVGGTAEWAERGLPLDH